MATSGLSDLDALSMEMFPEGDKYWNDVDQEAVLLDLFEKTSEIPFNGSPMSDGKDGWTFPRRTAGSANPMAPYNHNQSTSGLVTAGKQTAGQLKFTTKSHFQAMELRGIVFDSRNGPPESIVSGLNWEMENQALDARKELNILYHNNGSGRLATVTAVTDGDTLAVDTTARLPVGRQVEVRDLDGGTLMTGQTQGTALEVSVVNSSTSIDLITENGGTPSLSAGTPSDFGIYTYGGQGVACQGIAAMVEDSEFTDYGATGSSIYYGGIATSTANLWTGYRSDAGGGMPDIQLVLQPFLDGLKRRATHLMQPIRRGNATVKLYAFCGYQAFRYIGNALQADQRTAGGKMTLDGGYEAINYEGVMFVIDDDAPVDRIRFIAPSQVRRYVMTPLFWDDRAGGIWSRRTANDGRDADIFKAYKYTRQTMCTTSRLPHGEIYNLGTTA